MPEITVGRIVHVYMGAYGPYAAICTEVGGAATFATFDCPSVRWYTLDLAPGADNAIGAIYWEWPPRGKE